MQIRVAAAEPIAAEACMLRTISSCAKALPADTAEWDVSGLMYDGQPFSRETVSCWHSCARSLTEGLEELGPQDKQQLSTVAGLTQVLAFADAVGSRVGLCRAACSQLQQLKFVVQLPEQVLELPVAGCTYRFSKSSPKQLLQWNLQSSVKVGNPLASTEQLHDVQQQVAQQAAGVLRVAHVLRLQPLLDVLHGFLLLNVPKCAEEERMLSGVMDLVFTDAVLEAALGSSTFCKDAYISSVMSQPCSLTPGMIGHTSLLKPVGPRSYDASTDMLEFDAELLRDFAGGRAGDTVKVKLDLFGTHYGGRVTLVLARPGAAEASTWVTLPVQLLLGCSFQDGASLQDFLKVSPPE